MLEQETKKPGKIRGVIQKPESHDQNFSWLPGFLLKHVWAGGGAAPLGEEWLRPEGFLPPTIAIKDDPP